MLKLREKVIATMMTIIIIMANVLTTGTAVKKAYAIDNSANQETKQKEATIEEQIQIFVPYEGGIVLQTAIKTGIKHNMEQIKQAEIEIKVPTIKGEKPYKIEAIAKNEEDFNEDNYKYDEETNKLSIKVEDKNITEYIITYQYAKIEEIEEGVQVEFDSKLKITTQDEEELTATSQNEETLKEKIGNIVEIKTENITKQIGKGQIYTNYEIQEKLETKYDEKITIEVKEHNTVDKIEIEQNADYFLNQENAQGLTTIGEKNYTYYKQIKMNKESIKNLLGEEGEIKIYSQNTLIDTIKMEEKEETEQQKENNEKQVENSEQQMKNNEKQLENNEPQTNSEQENEDIIIDLEQLDINNIKIETTQPIKNEKLEIEVEKAIKGDIDYNKYQMLDFSNIQIGTQSRITKENTEIENKQETIQIPLVEPETVAQISINKENLSTVVLNENVEIKAILRTDTINNSLYKNPTIAITLPENIETIQVKNIEILFDEELKIKSANIQENADKTKTIIIALEGSQTKYSIGSMSGGANIIITADLGVNKKTPSKNSQIIMNYTNQNLVTRLRSMQEQKQTQAELNFIAPVGVITTNAIEIENQKATSLSGEENIIMPQVISNAKIAKIEMSVINNYSNTINNIEILGRFPFKNNKNIETGETLNSSTDMILQELITVENIDSNLIEIYYTENEEASKDLNNIQNGWTKTITDMQKIKSYLIVIKNHTLNPQEAINFSYKAQVPANMQYNESAYQMYVAYFDNNQPIGIIQDKAVATKTGFYTGIGPVIESNITSNIQENQLVQAGNIIEYTAQVKNAGTVEATNVVAKVTIPTHTIYVKLDESTGRYEESEEEELTYQIGTIKPGETQTIKFSVKAMNPDYEDIECDIESHFYQEMWHGEAHGEKVHMLKQEEHKEEDYKINVQAKMDITSGEIENPIKIQSNTNTIRKAMFNTEVSSNTYSGYELSEGEEYRYTVRVTISEPIIYEYKKHANGEIIKDEEVVRTNKIVENVIAKIKVPEGLNYKSAEIKYGNETGKIGKITYNDQTRELTINIGNMIGEEQDEIEVLFTVENLKPGEYKKDIEIQTTLQGKDTQEVVSNKLQEKIVKAGVKATQTSTIPQGTRLSGGDELSYKIKLENVGEKETDIITIKNPISENIQYLSTTYIRDGQENKTYNIINNETQVEISLEKLETVEIFINVQAKHITQDTVVTNKPIIESELLGQIPVNEITHTIEKDPQIVNPQNPGNQSQGNKKISGQIWLDENEDGIKDEDEPKMSNVSVMLFDNKASKLVENSNTKEPLIEVSDENGFYTFSNIPSGSYTVVFLYDVANYSSTTYKKENVSEEKNSDAIDTKVTLDGVQRIAAITEQITVNTLNIYNMDLGLVKSPKFDLKLEKTIKSITVQNSTGTAVYEYNNNFAKRDLTGRYLEQTTIAIEYSIKVTNEGAVTGYAKKIADYLPQNLNFVAELNRDWYVTESGVALNSSLTNQKIEPGQTKEVTLILTKKLTENDLGEIFNTAEIYEAYNDLGIEDIDSIPANKQENEDDISKASVILTIRTGETLIYITIIIGIISILVVATYLIKKKILNTRG